MSDEALAGLLGRVRDALAAGAWHELSKLGNPGLAWYQPGNNRLSGIHRGVAAVRGFVAELDAASDETRLDAFGTPVFNRGSALLPAAWLARRGDEQLRSQGALLVSMHADRVYELRWFADDTQPEDRFWGDAPPRSADGGAQAASVEALFEAATVRARTLRSPPPEATLLQLYALYKQQSEGDASGGRPGVFDPVGRAKYDAWAKLAGLGREAAMRGYIELVDSLAAKESPSAGETTSALRS